MEIGKTRAGIVIVYKPYQSIEDFRSEFFGLTDDDKFDYYCVFQWLVVKEMPNKDRRPEDFDWWAERVALIGNTLPKEVEQEQRSHLELGTSYEMVQFGKKMCNNFWRQS